MAWLRKIKSRKTGKAYYYVIDSQRRSHPCGTNRALALEALAEFENRQQRRKLGLQVEAPACTWTLGYVKSRDIEDARRQGKDVGTREKVWRAIFQTIPPETMIEAITSDLVWDLTKPGLRNSTIRRRRALLRFALAAARKSARSGYTRDPFVQLPELSERQGARRPIAMTRPQAARLLRLLDRPTARWARLQLKTASRPGERPGLEGTLLRYPPHKRGVERRFLVSVSLEGILRSSFAFSRSSWDRAVKQLGIHVRPHDLRHTALTWAAQKPGASLMDIQRLGGWKSPAMAQRYLHSGNEPLDPI